MVPNIPPSQDASTHQIWNSYLKEYRRYARDTKSDGRTVRLLYASQSSFGGIKIALYTSWSYILLKLIEEPILSITILMHLV